MVNIMIDDAYIDAYGHAECKEICGLLSGTMASLRIGLRMAGDGDAIILDKGHMHIDIKKIKSNHGLFLAHVAKECIAMLCAEYPKSFRIIGHA